MVKQWFKVGCSCYGEEVLGLTDLRELNCSRRNVNWTGRLWKYQKDVVVRDYDQLERWVLALKKSSKLVLGKLNQVYSSCLWWLAIAACNSSNPSFSVSLLQFQNLDQVKGIWCKTNDKQDKWKSTPSWPHTHFWIMLVKSPSLSKDSRYLYS